MNAATAVGVAEPARRVLQPVMNADETRPVVVDVSAGATAPGIRGLWTGIALRSASDRSKRALGKERT